MKKDVTTTKPLPKKTPKYYQMRLVGVPYNPVDEKGKRKIKYKAPKGKKVDEW